MTQSPWLTDYDLYLLAEGTHRGIYEKLGAHCGEADRRRGVHFAVWEPDAAQVSVIGDFNKWRAAANPLRLRGAGVWEGFVPDAGPGTLYKYRIGWRPGGQSDKADPYAFAVEGGSQGASRVWDLDAYRWNDGAWMANRTGRNCRECPISIYQVDLGSWRRALTYRQIAPPLADYVHGAGYTHVEFLPVTEGCAPNAGLGSPDDFMYLVDTLHRQEIGAILELKNGNARFWLDRYHMDGLRVGASTPDAEHAEFSDCLSGLSWNIEWCKGASGGLSENAVLALSQEGVVAGKGSLLAQMAGDEWRKFANLRLLYGYQFGLPGKKLIFMGSDFGQWNEWRHDAGLDWHWLQHPLHAGLLRWVRDLNTFYRGESSFQGGFEWAQANGSVIAFLRFQGEANRLPYLFVLNYTAQPRSNYRVGVPVGGYWAECLNSDAVLYGGSGQGNIGGVEAVPLASSGQPYSLSLTLPPLGALVLRNSRNQES